MPLDNLLFGTLVAIMFPRLSVISKGPVLLPACVNLIVITCDISFNYYAGGAVVVVVVVQPVITTPPDISYTTVVLAGKY